MIYFVQCGGMVKIGYSADVERRIIDLQIGSPLPLHLIGTIWGEGNLEQELHLRFKEHHIRGEWFEIAPPLLSFLEETFPDFSLQDEIRADVYSNLSLEEQVRIWRKRKLRARRQREFIEHRRSLEELDVMLTDLLNLLKTVEIKIKSMKRQLP